MPITLKRLSDNTTYVNFLSIYKNTINNPFKKVNCWCSMDADPKTLVLSIKSNLRKNYLPKFPNGQLRLNIWQFYFIIFILFNSIKGCRLMFAGKVMKSRHRLQHYGVMNNNTIEMDDRKNWSSSSSSSDSED